MLRKRTTIIFLFFLLLVNVFLPAFLPSHWVDTFYLPYIYAPLGTVLSSLSGVVSVSLWDSFWPIFIVLVLWSLITMIRKKKERKSAAAHMLIMLLFWGNWFFISWGHCYGRTPIDQKMGLSLDGLEKEDVVSAYTAIVKEMDVILEENEQWCAPSDSALMNLFTMQMHDQHIPLEVPLTRIKRMTLPSLYIGSGVLGYFGPFFNEVHINSLNYAKDFPYVILHELSHQQGVGSERDCNFMAFIIGANAKDSSVRYSVYLNALPYFISYFYSLPESERKPLLAMIPSIVKKDLRDRHQWYKQKEKKIASEIQEKANDLYLKSNGVEHGVMDYGRYFGMIIVWINQNRVSII